MGFWKTLFTRAPKETIVSLTQWEGHRPITLDVRGITGLTLHHTYAQKPPPPRPERLTVVYVMQDGREYRIYIPINGMAEWTESWPSWLTGVYNGEAPPQYIRYEFSYKDGSKW